MAKGFWAVPKSIAERKDLSLRAKFVAGILWTRKNSDFEAFPSRRYIAQALGTSIRTVGKAIKELKEKAGLKVVRRGLGRNNRYFFPDWDEPVSSLPEGNMGSHQERNMPSSHNIRDNQLRDTIVDEKESSALDVFEYFKNKVRDVKGFEPEIEWGKDGKLAKKRLKNYSLEEIKQLIDWYLRSKHCERLGVSLAVCLSGFVINLWKASKSQSNYLEKLYPTWQIKE
jgi:hypothetical protein